MRKLIIVADVILLAVVWFAYFVDNWIYLSFAWLGAEKPSLWMTILCTYLLSVGISYEVCRLRYGQARSVAEILLMFGLSFVLPFLFLFAGIFEIKNFASGALYRVTALFN